MVLVPLASPTSGPRSRRWLPVIAGYGAVLVVLGLAVAVSLPPPLARVAGVAMPGVGLAGGAVAGRLSRDLPTARRNGLLVGVAGGLSTALLVRGTMSLALPRARWSAIWTIEYAVARGLGGVLPSDLAARYDGPISWGVALTLGLFVFAGSVLAAGASAPIDVEPAEGE